MKRTRLVHVHEDPAWGKASIYEPVDDGSVDEVGIKIQFPSMTDRRVPLPSANVPVAVKGPSQHRMQDHSDELIEEQSELDLRELISSGISRSLSYFEASLFATVLEDVITQIRILAESNNCMRVAKVHSDYQHLQALKFGVQEALIENELSGINPYDLERIEYKVNKLDADRKFVADLFVKLYTNISTHYGFEVLTDCVVGIIEKERQFNQLVEDETTHHEQKKDLAKQLRNQRNQCKRVQYDADVQIDMLKTEIEDADLRFEITDRYVAKWQGARAACHDLIIAQTEARSTDSTEYHRRRADHEQRVHNEVELLTNIIINETLESVENWMNKYEIDMEAIDLKTQIKRNEWQNKYDKRVYLEEKYARHEKEIKAWQLFKVERDKANAYHDTMTKSAITVQAWWRGLLVRKELGPFRPKKKAKGKEKGKK